MATETLSAALEREHREIDEGIAAYTGGNTDPSARQQLIGALAALRRHIYLEEQFLFPPLRGSGLIAPVFVMVREHGQMWHALAALDAALADDGRPAADQLDPLVALLEAHNPKEEQILYPQADTALNGEASAELKTFIDTGELPGDWVCQRAG